MSKTDVALWCFKWVDGMGWKSPGGGMYRAPYTVSYGNGKFATKQRLYNV